MWVLCCFLLVLSCTSPGGTLRRGKHPSPSTEQPREGRGVGWNRQAKCHLHISQVTSHQFVFKCQSSLCPGLRPSPLPWARAPSTPLRPGLGPPPLPCAPGSGPSAPLRHRLRPPPLPCAPGSGLLHSPAPQPQVLRSGSAGSVSPVLTTSISIYNQIALKRVPLSQPLLLSSTLEKWFDFMWIC